MRISRSAKDASRARARVPRRRSLPALDWVEDVSGRCARATAIGSRCLLVENHTGILSFTSDCVRLATGGGSICVAGSGLTLCEVRPGALIVRGDIHRVYLPSKGGDASHEG